VSFLWGGS